MYSVGKEDLLPIEFRKSIPFSTITRWRKAPISDYAGSEFRFFLEDAFDFARLKKNNHDYLQKLISIGRAWKTLKPVYEDYIKQNRHNKERRKVILEAIRHLSHGFGHRFSLAAIGLSPSRYRQWALVASADCFDSYTMVCVKRHPNRLAQNEVLKIQELLTDPKLDCWPVVSIAGYALRTKEVAASLFSWYKYAALLGVFKKGVRKVKKTKGIFSHCPNQYLHIDTTEYQLMDDSKLYTAFISDNYSKMILGWAVSTKKGFKLVKAALEMGFGTVLSHPDITDPILVADGGKENHNREMELYLSRIPRSITKVTALKDIKFSNSPAEVINRIIKNRYLKNRSFESVAAYENFLGWAVKDYNEHRPHYKFKTRTPREVYFNIPLPFDVSEG